MIFQDSLSALNPVYTVGNKMVELIRRHTSMTKKEAKARVLELLTAVGITDPEKAYILPAKLLALTVYKLLKNGGQEAKKIAKSDFVPFGVPVKRAAPAADRTSLPSPKQRSNNRLFCSCCRLLFIHRDREQPRPQQRSRHRADDQCPSGGQQI